MKKNKGGYGFSQIFLILVTAVISGLLYSCAINPALPPENNAVLNLNNSGIASKATVYNGRLTGVNWFGFETGNLAPHGLWSRDYKSMLQQIKDLGFNSIRLPWCDDVLTGMPNSIQVNAYGVDAYTGKTGLNLDLAGLTSIQVMDKVISYCDTLGLKIILDHHSLVHDDYMNETLWYTPSIPESTWINDWVTLVSRYKNNPSVVGVDLKNEPHGNLEQGMKPPASWGYDVPGYGITDFKAAAERCAQAILAVNPNLKIIVEGVEEYKGDDYWWGGNLSGVKDYPITAIPAQNLMYSAHEYGPEVYNQPWFSDPTFPANMQAIWDKHFWFIQTQGIGQLYFGEFGIQEASAADPSSVAYKWITTFMTLMGKTSSWAFWSFNPDSGDTGGILQDDWVTVNPAKYGIIKPYLAAFDGGGQSSSSSSATVSSSSAASSSSISSSSSSQTSSSSSSASSAGVVGQLKVQFFNANTAPLGNQIYSHFLLVNTGSTSVALSDVKIRYYYTEDGTQAQNFWCDWSPVGNINVTGSFAAYSPLKPIADTYFEVGFTSAAGSMAPGSNIEIQTRVAKADWSNYDQSNDYSFNPTATSFVDWSYVTASIQGTVVWGILP